MSKKKKHVVGGVYLFRNLVSGKGYVGAFFGPSAKPRWSVHEALVTTGKGFYLHNAVRRYGWAAFSREVVWHGAASEVLSVERQLIKELRTKAPYGYNLTDGGEGTPNPSARSRRLMSRAHKGVRRTAAEKEALRVAHEGVALTPEHRSKLAAFNKATWARLSEEERSVKCAHLQTNAVVAKREATLKERGSRVGDAAKAEKCRAASTAMWTDEFRIAMRGKQRRAWARKSAKERSAIGQKVWVTRRAKAAAR